MRWTLGAVGLVFVAGLIAAFILVPPYVDRQQTRVIASFPKPEASTAAKELHMSSRVADLHADSLVWGRDLLGRTGRGQVDVPRLRQGNVAVQVFSVPTKVPNLRGPRGTDPNSLDLLTLSAIAQLWRPSAWFSLKHRALYLAERFKRFERRGGDELQLVRDRKELREALQTGAIGGVLALEGMHCLEGDLGNLEALFGAGYRIGGLVHQFDNRLGGSSYGLQKGGLTPFGEQVITRMEELRMIVDVAHASEALIRDVLQVAKRPVLVSHTGVRGTCDRSRNLSDDQLRAIAAAGGLIGVGFWAGAVCGLEPFAVGQAIRHAVDVVGLEHVALGQISMGIGWGSTWLICRS